MLIHQSSASVENQRKPHPLTPDITNRIRSSTLRERTLAGRSGHAWIGPLAGKSAPGAAGYRDGDLRPAGPQPGLRALA